MSKKHLHDAQPEKNSPLKGYGDVPPSSEMPHLRGAAFSDF